MRRSLRRTALSATRSIQRPNGKLTWMVCSGFWRQLMRHPP
nr:MAG TPA: hypothetical protein [Caudoviricetes sp.]